MEAGLGQQIVSANTANSSRVRSFGFTSWALVMGGILDRNW